MRARYNYTSRINRYGFVLVGLLILALTSPHTTGIRLVSTAAALNQDPNAATGANVPQETIEQAEEAQSSAGTDNRLIGDGDREPDYSDVLASPDDIALSFAFAKKQVRQGNLRGAAATLERILLLDQNLPEVRLFYAFVLIRLDSLDAAKRELDRLQTYDMPDELRRQLSDYRDRLELRRKKTRFELLVGLGGSYAWNSNAIPDDRILNFFGIPVTLDDSSRRRGDFAYTGFSKLDMNHDLGRQAPDALIGSFTHYRSERVEVKEQDAAAVNAEFGLKLAYPGFTLKPQFTYSYLRLSDQTYYQAPGVEVSTRFQLPPKQEGFARLAMKRETFSPIQESSNADDDTGYRIDFRGGITHSFNGLQKLTLQSDLGVKRGRTNADSYREFSIEGRFLQLFRTGDYLTTALRTTKRWYKRPDSSNDPGRTRVDRSLRLRLGAGTPLGNWVEFDWAGSHLATHLEKAIVSGSLEWTRKLSTVRNFEFDNPRAEVLVTRRWEF